MGYPDAAAEMEMLQTHQSVSPLETVTPVASGQEVAAMISVVHAIYVSTAVKEYTVALGRATRESPLLRLGASPRALLQLLRAGKAYAALRGRDFVLPDDVVAVADPVLAHRIIPDRKAASSGETPSSIIAGILAKLPVNGESASGRRSAAPRG